MPQFVQSEQQKELINSLVQELPAYRKKMRMSQAELGDAVGKSRQKISEMERGAAPLGWDTYLAILMVLGAHGVLEPRGRDAERLAATGRLIVFKFIEKTEAENLPLFFMAGLLLFFQARAACSISSAHRSIPRTPLFRQIS